MRRPLRHTIVALAALCSGLSVLWGCGEKPAQQPQITALEQKPKHTFTQNGSVKEMVIWPETPEFPEHEGKAEFVSYCGICHSLRYVSMQPAFSRKIWEAEVHKMVEKYGAPIDSTNSRKIVDYLMAINGTAD